MKENDGLSVLLPFYNSCETLFNSVQSILKQTYEHFELLLLDDGSNDGSSDIATKILDNRICYHKLAHQGLAKTLNYGLSIAKYDIIARMDADDLCVPRRFEKQLLILRQLKINTIISSWYGIFNDSKLNYIITTPVNSIDIKKGLLLHSYISHPGLMCYKSALLDNGGYCNRIGVGAFEDYETWLKIKDKVEFYIIPEVLMFQRYRKESLSNNILYKQRIMYSIQQPYYDNLLLNFAISDKKEQNLYHGWREYYFGKKKYARAYWKYLGIYILKQPRVIMAWFVTYLPEDIFVKFKESRMKFRLQYLFLYNSPKLKKLRIVFGSLLKPNTR